jgi:hypothetical protein
MQIAGDKRLTNVSQGKHLPPSWTTLYELTKLDDATFDQKLRDGSINPEMHRVGREVALTIGAAMPGRPTRCGDRISQISIRSGASTQIAIGG